MNGTWATIKRAPCCSRATILAMLGISGGRGELAPVKFFVAGYAKRKTINNIGYQFGIIRNLLYMVGMNISTNLTAFLAGIVIPSINGISPFSKIAFCFRALTMQGFTALPGSSILARQRFTTARAGTESGSLVATIEFFAAKFALTFLGRVAMRPTYLRAIFGRISAVCLDLVNRTADSTCFLHVQIIPHYCAVVIERVTT